MRLAGFVGILISEYCNSPAPENLSCNLLSKGNSVQNIVHDLVYPAGFADVNYVMSQAQKSSIPELGGLIERGLLVCTKCTCMSSAVQK